MKKTAISTISSRNGDPRYVTSHGGGCYTIEGKTHYSRQAVGENGQLTMFDFEDGPCFYVGEQFSCDPSNPNAVIESIIVDSSVAVPVKYVSAVDGKEKTTNQYQVKISITVE